MKRLQGKEWHQEKDKYRLLYTCTSDRGNIQGIYQEIDGKKRVNHWMNNEEKEEYLKIGDYFRLKEGLIGKIVKDLGKDAVYKNMNHYLSDSIWLHGIWSYYIYQEDVKKSSKDILDLLEIGDLLYVDISPDDCGGIVVPRIAETKHELNNMLGFLRSGEWILKGIVTKEHLEKSCYWL